MKERSWDFCQAKSKAVDRENGFGFNFLHPGRNSESSSSEKSHFLENPDQYPCYQMPVFCSDSDRVYEINRVRKALEMKSGERIPCEMVLKIRRPPRLKKDK
jgi:hypothetical protein